MLDMMKAFRAIKPKGTAKKKVDLRKKTVTKESVTKQKPLSDKTRSDVLAALVGGEWVEYAELCRVTGLVRGTIGRAARLLTAEGLTTIKLTQVGRGLPGHLKLIKPAKLEITICD